MRDGMEIRKILMKTIHVIPSAARTALLTLLSALLLLAPPCGAVIVDRIVAIVNDQVITLYQLEQKAAPLFARYITPDLPRDQAEERRKEIMARILPQLVDDVLVQNEIEKKGLAASEQEVDQAIKSICRQNGLDLREFAEKLRSQGFSLEKYREQIKQQIERTRLINSEVKSKIVVTDDEISRYYATTSGNTSYDGPYYDLSMINIAPDNPDDPDSRAAAEKRAVEAYKKLKVGTPFEKVASEYAHTSSGEGSVHLGQFSADEMDPFIRKIIVELAPGEFSKVIDMPSGYQIFRLNGISSTLDVKVPEDEKEEIREKLYQDKMEERFQQWLDDLRAKSAIRILL